MFNTSTSISECNHIYREINGVLAGRTDTVGVYVSIVSEGEFLG